MDALLQTSRRTVQTVQCDAMMIGVYLWPNILPSGAYERLTNFTKAETQADPILIQRVGAFTKAAPKAYGGCLRITLG